MKHILLVDDDAAFLSSLAEMLRSIDGDFAIYTAEDGEQAQAVVKVIPLDLVITDLRMPVMNGSKLMSWMREHSPDTPVIIMSACAELGPVDELENKGYSFIDKPLDITDLVKRIRSRLP